MKEFLLCFIPLFVATDPLGLVPIFVAVTAGFNEQQRRKLVLQAIPAALAIGLTFFVIGGPLLRFLQIDINDMRIAGGLLLFVYAMLDLFVPGGKPSVDEADSIGIVPLATPMIVGPAVLTLGVVLVQTYGLFTASLAFICNIVILTASMLFVNRLLKYFPLHAMKAVSKVIDLLLAAIGVAFVRQGVMNILQHSGS